MTSIEHRAADERAVEASRVRGRTDVKERVLQKIIREASATAIGVPRDSVHADVSDFRSGLFVRLSTPLPVPHLGDLGAVDASTSVVERATRLQSDLRRTFTDLLGREVDRIDLVVTGAVTPARRRVR